MTTTLGIALNQLAAYADLIIETTFPDVCSIERPDFSTGDYGTSGSDYSPVESSIGCAWAPAGKTGMEYMRAAQINEVVVYEVTMPAGTGVTPKDRVVIAARGNEPEHTFEVKAVIRNAGLPLLVLCTLEEQ
jgi:hypothetical protein